MFKDFTLVNSSISLNSPTIRILSNFLVFLGIVSPGLVYLPMESMRVLSFSCLIIVHLLFFYKRLLNQRHTEFLVLFILIFGFLLIESHEVLYEGNFGLFRFIIVICFGLIFSYCTYQRSDYFLPALSITCLFLFTAYLLLVFFNVELYFKPDGTPSSAFAGQRFLPLPFLRAVLFSSPKEISILFGVMFVYFSILYSAETTASNNIKKSIVKRRYLAILILISFFMVIAAQTISTFIFIIFYLIFLVQSRMNNNLRIIFNYSISFLIIIGLFILGNGAVKISESYIGSFNVIKDSLFNGIVEQISSAIMIGPGIGYFDTHASALEELRFVSHIEDSSLFLRLIFEVGLIPVLTFALFIIIRFKEGFTYILYIAVASLPLGHYHTAYILGILGGSLIMLRKKTNVMTSVFHQPLNYLDKGVHFR